MHVKRKRFMVGHDAVGQFITERLDRLCDVFPRARVMRWRRAGYIVEDVWPIIVEEQIASMETLLRLHDIAIGPQRILTVFLAVHGSKALDGLANDIGTRSATVRGWRALNHIPARERDPVLAVLKKRFGMRLDPVDLEGAP